MNQGSDIRFWLHDMVYVNRISGFVLFVAGIYFLYVAIFQAQEAVQGRQT